MGKSKRAGKPKRRRVAPTNRKPKAGQLALGLGSPANWPMVKHATATGSIRGKPETFPAGVAMDARGWPVFSLVLREPHPRTAKAIELEMKARADLQLRRDAEAARLAKRPVAMQSPAYKLPDELVPWLRKRCPIAMESDAEWGIMHALGWPDDRKLQMVLHEQIAAAVDAAYLEGCRQGFIEGFVARREPDKQRSKTGNIAKRATVVQLPDGRRMTRDERDALMAAEYESLLALKLKKTPAMDRLAGKYGLGGWQAVSKAIEKFHERSGG